MKRVLVLSLLCLMTQFAFSQNADEDDVYNEAGMIAKVKEQAAKTGYTIFREPTDTSKTFTAEPGHSYRLVLIFREHIETPGRRLVVYKRDKAKNIKTLYMARKDQHINSLNGHMLVTEVPAAASDDKNIYMTIDALPKEGKLFIFRK